MRFGSVCSGIEAASVAWRPLGWEAAFYSEIDPFPCTVLNHHYECGRPQFMPDPEAAGLNLLERRARRAAIKAVKSIPEILNPVAPNLGDMTQFKDWPDDIAIDLLVGGTPCQSFSIAGFRKGLDDPRGNLLLTYLAVAAKYRPRWLVWENVPGVLSSNKGRDFGALLWGMGELGYGVSYRVLDAQFCRASHLPFAVPQRRRRVFVVGYLGDWRRAAAVLFDTESLFGNPPPRREAGKRVAGALTSSAARRGGVSEGERGTLIEAFGGNNTQGSIDVATAVRANVTPHYDFESETFMVAPDVAPTMRAGGNATGGDRPPGTDVDTADSLIPEVAGTIDASAERSRGAGTNPGQVVPEVAHSLTAKPWADSGDAQGDKLIPEPPYAFKASHYTRDKDGKPTDVYPALSADADKGDQDPLVLAPVYSNKAVQVGAEEPQGDQVKPIAFDHLAGGKTGFAVDDEVAGALRVSGNAVGHQSVAIPFDTTQITHPENRSNPQPGNPSGTLPKAGHAPAIAYGIRNDAAREGEALTPSPDAEGKIRLRNPGMGISEELAPTIDAGQPHTVAYNITPSNSNKDYKANETEHAQALTIAAGKPPSSRGGTIVQMLWRVRRLLPVECARLQGFPDDYLSQVKYRGKPPADGPMYKALGNSKATNVVRNIGERIAIVDVL